MMTNPPEMTRYSCGFRTALEPSALVTRAREITDIEWTVAEASGVSLQLSGRHASHLPLEIRIESQDGTDNKDYCLSIAVIETVEGAEAYFTWRAKICEAFGAKLRLASVQEEIRATRDTHHDGLNLCDQDLTELPPEIGTLQESLKWLDLTNNRLTKLPDEIVLLEQLTDLHVSDNLLTELPANIGRLTRLKMLSVERNRLRQLPPSVGQLTGLKELFVNDNKLRSLPTEIGQLTQLRRLFIQQNRITDLPPEFARLEALVEPQFSKPGYIVTPRFGLLALGNPWIHPPEEIVRKGRKAIKEFLTAHPRRIAAEHEKAAYTVYVDDNYHQYEVKRRILGTFHDCSAAVQACKDLVDNCLFTREETKAEDLVDAYRRFGEDPWICSDDPGCVFDAWSYAEQRCREIVAELAGPARKGMASRCVPSSADLEKRILALIAEIDLELTRHLNTILHFDGFQRLEASWRGLHYLVHRSDAAADLKFRLLDVSKTELRKYFERYNGSDPVGPLAHLYNDVYRAADGEPFGCLIGDYWFDHTASDSELLTEIANLAALWHAPFFAGAAESLLGVDAWRDVNSIQDLDARFAAPEYGRWRSLRESEDSRFVGLVLPRMLARAPFVATPKSSGDFALDEAIGSDADYCWTNPVYALALQWMRAFAKYGWFGAMEAVETDSDPEFPKLTFPCSDAGVRGGNPLEVAVSDKVFADLRRHGLVPLLHHHVTKQPCWFAVPSLCKPSVYPSADLTTAALFGVQMRYVMCASRFASHMTLIARDGDGNLLQKDEIESRLTSWLQSYVSYLQPDPEKPSALRPLAESRRILVHSVEAAGHYATRLMIRPEYLMPEANLFVVRVRLTGRSA